MVRRGITLSCLPVSLYGDFVSGALSLTDWFELARAAGYDGADISVAHLESLQPAYLRGLRSAAASIGVQIPMLVTYSDFTHPDPEFRERQKETLKLQIDAASQLGAKCVRLTAGQSHPGVTEEDGLFWAVDGLNDTAAYASRQGVVALYENHVRGSVWSWNDFTQPVHRFCEVALKTLGADSPLRLLFDTANNLALHDDPLNLLPLVADHTEAIHLADIKEPGSFRPVPPGTGTSPHLEILRFFVQRGWEGILSVEEASGNGTDGIRRARAYADRIWTEAGGESRETGRI